MSAGSENYSARRTTIERKGKYTPSDVLSVCRSENSNQETLLMPCNDNREKYDLPSDFGKEENSVEIRGNRNVKRIFICFG